jgi:hypothetical protein
MFRISKYIDIYVLIISFVVGFLIVYMTTDENRIIHIYPTPENEELMLYRDKAHQCFTFQHKEVSCPVNPLDISTVPIQG